MPRSPLCCFWRWAGGDETVAADHWKVTLGKAIEDCVRNQVASRQRYASRRRMPRSTFRVPTKTCTQPL
eukprot:232092-Amphidinium_carterae.1